MRTLNSREHKILEFIRFNGPQSRTLLAKAFELTPSALTRIAQSLIDKGVLQVARRLHEGQRGQPPELLEIDPTGAYTIGVSLHPGQSSVCLVNLTGQAVDRRVLKLAHWSPPTVMEMVSSAVETMMAAAKVAREKILGAGLSVPGLFLSDPKTINPIPEQITWAGIDVAHAFEQCLGMPVIHENDGNVAALSEAFFGVGRKLRSFAFILVGAGVGGGWVIERQLYRGAHGNAAEFGSLHPRPMRRPSAQDLMEQLRERGVMIGGLAEMNHMDLPSEMVDEWIAGASRQLAELVLALTWTMDPQAVVIGSILPSDIQSRLVAATAALDLRQSWWTLPLPTILASEQSGFWLDVAAAHLPIIFGMQSK